MTIRADYTPSYFRRFLIIGVGCLAVCLWFLYDGLIGYQDDLERSKIYWAMDESEREEKWKELFQEKGWPTNKKPEPVADVQHDIDSQFFWAVICVLVAVPCLLKWYLARGTYVECDGKTVRASWGKQNQFDLDQVVSIDKSRWDRKGIANVRYEVDGRPRLFVLDDFKYNREKIGEMVRLIESRLPDDQIVGGEREPPPEPGDDEVKPNEQA